MFRRSTHPLTLAMGFALVAALVAPGTSLAASTNVKVQGVDLHCSFETADANWGLDASARVRSDGANSAFVDVGIEPKDPAAMILVGGMDDPSITKRGMNATFEMADDATGETVGSATVSAAFTVTRSQHFVAVYQKGTQKGIFYTLRVVGTLSVTAGAVHFTFDLAGCDANAQSRRDHFHDVKPAKPGAKRPANDLPESALTVAAGSHVRIQTEGASALSEVDCDMSDQDGEFHLPFGRTVWFKVVGTGRPITVDSIGSDFDTVVAAFVQTGAGLEPVTCVDDGTGPINTPKQAAVTIDTRPGATYLVEIGGISDPPVAEFGHLKVKVY